MPTLNFLKRGKTQKPSKLGNHPLFMKKLLLVVCVFFFICGTQGIGRLMFYAYNTLCFVWAVACTFKRAVNVFVL